MEQFEYWITTVVGFQEALSEQLNLKIASVKGNHAILEMDFIDGGKLPLYVTGTPEGVVAFYIPTHVAVADMELFKKVLIRNVSTPRGYWCLLQTPNGGLQLGLGFRTSLEFCDKLEFGMIITGLYLEFLSFTEEMREKIAQLNKLVQDAEISYWEANRGTMLKM